VIPLALSGVQRRRSADNEIILALNEKIAHLHSIFEMLWHFMANRAAHTCLGGQCQGVSSGFDAKRLNPPRNDVLTPTQLLQLIM
jgi:hypothetical protein